MRVISLILGLGAGVGLWAQGGGITQSLIVICPNCVQTNGTALVSGRVPFATTGGTLTDNSGFLWNNSLGTLTATTVADGASNLLVSSPSTNSSGAGIQFQSNVGVATKTSVFQMDNAGNLVFRQNTSGNMFFDFISAAIFRNSAFTTVMRNDGTNFSVGKGNISSVATLFVNDNTATTGVTTTVVRAGAGQSTTDLMQWQDNSATVLSRVGFDGRISVGTTTIGTTGAPDLSLRSGAFQLTTNSTQSTFNSSLTRYAFNDNGFNSLLSLESATSRVCIGPQNVGCGAGTLTVYDATAATGVTLATFRAGAGQGSANFITQVVDNSLANLFGVRGSGGNAKLMIGGDTTNGPLFRNNGSSLQLLRGNESNGITLTLTNLRSESGGIWSWSSSSSDPTIAADTGIARTGPGAAEINSGTTGQFRALNLSSLTGFDPTAVTGVTKWITKAGAGQSTTNVQEWQDNSGVVRASLGGSNQNVFKTQAGLFGWSAGAPNGGLSLAFYNSGFQLAGNYPITWGTLSNDASGTPDTGINRNAAGVVGIFDGVTGTNFRDIKLRSHIGGGTAPAVATCGTVGTGSTNIAGFITSTVTGTCTPVVTFSGTTAPTGWSCSISNGTTTANLMSQSGSSTTTATFTGTTVTGDVLRYACTAY